MSRKNIFELLEREYNLSEEAIKIEKLITDEKYYYESGYAPMSLETHVNNGLFRKWEYRDTTLNTNEFREWLQIDKVLIIKGDINLKTFLKYAEYVHNMLYLCAKNFNTQTSDKVSTHCRHIFDNLEKLIESYNFEKFVIDEKDVKIIVVEKNPAATAVAEIVESDDISIEVIRYNHFLLKGDLNEKRKILTQLYKEFEKLSKKLSKNGDRDIFSELGFLFNTLKIRHEKGHSPFANKRVEEMNPKELEEWYDKTYEAFLAASLFANYLDIAKEAEELRKLEE